MSDMSGWANMIDYVARLKQIESLAMATTRNKYSHIEEKDKSTT